LLAALVGARVRVRVTIDGLETSFGVLELHLIILVILLDSLLFALPLLRWCAIVAWLQLLLVVKLLHKLLDLLALLGVAMLGVVYRAPWNALITVEGLSPLFVARWATTPTSCCSYSRGSTSQRLVLSTSLLLILLLLASALSSGICIGLAISPFLWVGCECQACHSVALVHVSAKLKSSETSCTSCLANFSSIFSSLMPYRNATTTDVLEIQGMVF
jgi:hypothetical protein